MTHTINNNEVNARMYAKKLHRLYRNLKARSNRGEDVFASADPLENALRMILVSHRPGREETLSVLIHSHLQKEALERAAAQQHKKASGWD